METYSSGEELVIKTRKPYTITKQRERWTEEEHNRFLEALKLYGRAWQRIEEHIGTKTAVQIRSHAQKFFSKLEKEALAKGLPVGQALDIDIPPPRPKRKPNNPYPRKTGTMASACQVDAKDGKSVVLATSCGKQVLKLEKEPERSNGEKKPTSSRDAHNVSHSEAVTLLHVANCSSELSVNINSCTFKDFIRPLMQIAQESDTRNASNSTSSCIMHEKPVPEEKKDGSDSGLPPTEVQVIQNHPRHIPVHVLDGNLAVCGQVIHPGGQIQNSTFHPLAGQGEQLNLFADPAVSVTTEHQNNAPRNQTYPTFHPPCAVMCPNPEEYQSFLQASSASSSLIVSTLLQNPAAYSAASFASSFFPYAYTGSSTDSPECGQEGFQPKQVGSTRSMAAIAAATVAAATAWWAAHGLLCVCAPICSPFPCPPTSDLLIQPMDIVQVQGGKEHGDHGAYQNPPTTTELIDPKQSAAFEARHSPSKSQTSLLVSQGCGDIKLHDETKTVDHNNALVENAFHDANKSKGRKQADRSSCGSNTASSSDVETDTFKKNGTGKEVPKKVDDLPMSESSNRRSRSTSNMGDSWKEVSEEGRLAFQALFFREVLPQSFSPEHNRKNKDHHNKNVEENGQTKSKNNGDAVAMDLNSRTKVSSHNQGFEKHALTIGETNPDEGLLTMGLGHVRLKGRRTGFKPYKRCSVESKEKRVASIGSEDGGKGHKKIRLEEEAST